MVDLRSPEERTCMHHQVMAEVRGELILPDPYCKSCIFIKGKDIEPWKLLSFRLD
jgi:hypothetical protein